MQKSICVIEGDGIGPEVMAQAIKVLNKVALKLTINIVWQVDVPLIKQESVCLTKL